MDERLFLHAGLDLLALAVERVELLRDVERARFVVGDQRFDAERHVREASGGVEARADHEAEVHAAGLGRIAAGGAEEGANARRQLALAHALQALIDEDAVVAVELDHVGDGAERDEVEQRARFGSLRSSLNQPRSRNSERSASMT
jgi:hypothetical protein